jgi:hypothetical protein
LAGTITELAPTWPERRIDDPREFIATYQARLCAFGVPNIEQRLKSGIPTGRIALLCFENLEGIPADEQPFVCHRRAFAAWWAQETGDVVPELS